MWVSISTFYYENGRWCYTPRKINSRHRRLAPEYWLGALLDCLFSPDVPLRSLREYHNRGDDMAVSYVHFYSSTPSSLTLAEGRCVRTPRSMFSGSSSFYISGAFMLLSRQTLQCISVPFCEKLAVGIWKTTTIEHLSCKGNKFATAYSFLARRIFSI